MMSTQRPLLGQALKVLVGVFSAAAMNHAFGQTATLSSDQRDPVVTAPKAMAIPMQGAAAQPSSPKQAVKAGSSQSQALQQRKEATARQQQADGHKPAKGADK